MVQTSAEAAPIFAEAAIVLAGLDAEAGRCAVADHISAADHNAVDLGVVVVLHVLAGRNAAGLDVGVLEAVSIAVVKRVSGLCSHRLVC